MTNFAVLASGNGSNLQAILDALKKKKLKGTLKVVISDREGAFALARARKAQVHAVFVDPQQYAGREAYDAAVLEVLREHEVKWVVCAGFMRIFGVHFISAMRNRIINIHPSLLPSFKGAHGIRDAFLYGVKLTGVTVHFVDEEVDHGAIIAQAAVEVTAKDTLESLEKKIHLTEHKLYPETLQKVFSGKIRIVGRKTK